MKFINSKTKKEKAPSRIEFCEGLGCDELFSSGVLRTPSAHAYSSEWNMPPSRGDRRTKWPSIPSCPEMRREFLW